MRLARPVGDALSVVGAQAAVGAACTWPLLRDISSRIGGDQLDPFQTLWGFWWWRHSLENVHSPMYSPLLWWPDGVPLWFQTWDIPSTLAASALWDLVPPVAIYNLLLFASFPLAGLTCFWLNQELWGGRLAPFLTSCLYTFSTFHYAAASANLHIASMQWSPLYFMALLRSVRVGGGKAAVVAGAYLAITATASIYHAVFCVVGTAVLLVAGVLGDRPMETTRRLVVTAAAFSLATGWLWVGMGRAYAQEAYVGQHDPVRFSADLLSFVLPNEANASSSLITAWRAWTPSRWSSGGYLGYVLIGLGAVGYAVEARARPFILVAGVGLVLALGPYLQVGGTAYVGALLPGGWAEMLVPVLRFGGIPGRFQWLVLFGVVLAAGASLSRLCARSRRGQLAAVCLTVAGLSESWPRPFVTTPAPPVPRLTLPGGDPKPWVVLDLGPPGLALWNQVQHQQPMIAGYVTRTPKRLREKLQADSVLAGLLRAAPATSGSNNDRARFSQGAVRARLQSLRVRFIIVDATDVRPLDALQLSRCYEDGRIAIYVVPTMESAETSEEAGKNGVLTCHGWGR